MPKVRSDIQDLGKYRSQAVRRSKYGFLDNVMDGKVHELEKGKDFKVAPESMRSTVQSYAHSRDIPVVVRVEGGNVLVQKIDGRVKKPQTRKSKRRS